VTPAGLLMFRSREFWGFERDDPSTGCAGIKRAGDRGKRSEKIEPAMEKLSGAIRDPKRGIAGIARD